MDTGLGLLERNVPLGTGDVKVFDVGGCVVDAICEVCGSNSCPPITPPCKGVSWLASMSSGT
jgi:NADH:ubiquinone oxidoreductase subunit F (NADH-binding)